MMKELIVWLEISVFVGVAVSYYIYNKKGGEPPKYLIIAMFLIIFLFRMVEEFLI